MGEQGPRPVRPRISARASYLIAPLVRPNRLYRAVAARLERMPRALRLFTGLERRGKEALYGCRMCGQCALPATAYACPMTCPKQLRNGPCGGVAANGDCEVHPGQRCVWLIAWERAAATGHDADLALLQRPIDQRLRGTSSWVHYWLGRDEGLWTGAGTVDLGMPRVRP
ncbi:methylenetetrahydrofolate reductase C-terminal domain-containing protein [Pseudonocardia sichuanensis]|uniref:Methylene-tetrahydrofolate reductase-like protein n=1 Tax=Pseudonocardia kunmingensis TaxID=630975 RepID=A0A543D1D6_9PSEU|nr:methylenetetrahydrofolate reductase C-terminal domain-containing protein [Pseudonocardia kunmingensis]TQM03147.1 methylene-tetrahydrofolate reductase-like protein [Pseudonocardia kunmingensis]